MQRQISYRKLTSVLIHSLVWTVFGLAIFYYQPLILDIDVPYQFWVKQTVTLSLLIITFYFNSFVLVPRLLLKRHPAYFFVIIIGMMVSIVFIHRSLDRVLRPNRAQEENIGSSRRPSPPIWDPGKRRVTVDMITIAICALVVGISTVTTAVQKWQKDNQERKELEKEKISSELSFLKAQINPHFFFNTLNNIYALTEVDPKVAGEAILQLSRMMRYLLYDTQQGNNMLSQEIAFMKNYISLMKLRLTDVVKININIPANLQDRPLAPMILLPFVENAFKHGVSATKQSYIDIIIFQKDKVLDVTVKNSVMKDNSISLDANSGIGLVNTRRRLDLLYPGKYKLNISGQNAASEYNVHLVLDLS